MATRTIVTSQPDVACDVCARRLLRGEQPDVFLAAGRRRIVCELCAPRAAHEGWLRETDGQSVSLPPLRPRRGRSLFERFRARQVGADKETANSAPPRRPTATATAASAVGAAVVGSPGGDGAERQPYDLLDGYAATTPAEGPELADGASQPGWATEPTTPTDLGAVAPAASEGPPSYVEQALVVFNASEFPRRVAGVARSLGAPEVNVRSAEHLDSVVSIVVAWELCWYRYEVDLSEPGAEAQAIAQGTELAELAREDRQANAAAVESGALVLAGM
jgi:hypothetical protein